MRILFVSMLFLLQTVVPAHAFTPTTTDTAFDPTIVEIDEDKFLGKSIPDISMIDSKGKAMKTNDLLGKPWILSIVYYECVASCPVLNEGLSESLSDVSLRLGMDYNVLTVSFREDETIENAAQFKKKLQIKMKKKVPENFDKWIFAISSKEDIDKLTNAVGYKYFYSKQDQIYVHANVYLFISPQGKITRYLFGLYPIASDVKLALMEAANGKIGKSEFINAFTLACFKYDPSLGGYKLNLPFIFGMVSIVLAIITGVIVFFFAKRMKRQKGQSV